MYEWPRSFSKLPSMASWNFSLVLVNTPSTMGLYLLVDPALLFKVVAPRCLVGTPKRILTLEQMVRRPGVRKSNKVS